MLRVGILGAGHLGRIHLGLLKNLKEFEVSGFYDRNPEVAAKIERELGLKSFESADSLIRSCDAVDIVTPTPSHFNYAEAAIKAGRHIFIEKPVTSNSEEAQKLLRLVQEAHVIAHTGHVERFNPAFLAATALIERPVFIDCRRIAVYNPRGTDVSVVLDLMVHDIDLILNLVKSPIKKISATGWAVVSGSEDIAEARLEFENGCIATLRANRVATGNLRKMSVFQPENYFVIDFLEKTAVESSIKPGNAPGEKYVSHEKLAVNPINAIEHELNLFARAVQKKPMAGAVTLDEAYKTMKVADDIQTTIRKNIR